jgi:hypothetical protein
MRFFFQQHGARCPVTGKPEVISAVREDDPDYRPLPAEKQWRPESFPGYRPEQPPKSVRYTTGIRERLHGIWATTGFGGHSFECLVFLTDGTGVVEYWNGGLAGHGLFRWRLERKDHLVFGGPEEQPAEPADVDAGDGAAEYFGTERAYFELILYTNVYGEQCDRLCVYRGSIEEDPQEFVRSPQSAENYKIPEREEG